MAPRKKTAEEWLEEWTDYLGEMTQAIESGYFDNILTDMVKALVQRKHALDERDPMKAAATMVATVSTYRSRYDLLGKVVRVSKTVNPRWSRGLKVRVVKLGTKKLHCEWVDNPVAMGLSESRLAHARIIVLPIEMLDLQQEA